MTLLIDNPFDELATDYDASFTNTLIGRLMRQAVWQILDRCFPCPSRILELNCGTGEDAVQLARNGHRVLATDVSASMIDRARCKATAAGVADLITFRQLAIESLDQLDQPHALDRSSGPESCDPCEIPFDGVLSNFGGLNCAGDLMQVSRQLGQLVAPRATVVLCVMGPLVPWEWAYYLARLSPSRAFRRLKRGGCSWRGLVIRYPSIRRFKSCFHAEFATRRVSALGALVPPPYLEAWAQRFPSIVGFLNRLERKIESWPLLPSLADHYVIEMIRK
ncbi:MAG: methyltransferase domain-containing protein [Planctomycetota bacterium]|nr:methyltransferase domain-containing protein [Planctomycetota bacterium]